MALSAAKSELVAGLFAVAPEDALRRLVGLLSTAAVADRSLEPVHAIASAEANLRRIVTAVFDPLLALAEGGEAPKHALIRKADLTSAWRRIAAQHDDLAERVLALVRTHRPDDEPPLEFDTVCAIAADACQSEDLARWLRLTPVLRRVEPRLEAWVRNLSGENVAAVRLAFKDALVIDEDAGPAFWEAVFAMLEQPWQVLRLISAVIDRPSDRYLASSELSDFGERLLADIDRRISAVRSFDPMQGEAGGAAAAAGIAVGVQMIAEFEAWLALAKDGPWGQRIHGLKRSLALTMEARLREVEPAVAAALPTQPVRGTGRSVRPVPKLSADPTPLHVAKADALLTLMDEARTSANTGGYAGLRAKTIEALEKRLDQYCEDLLEALRHGAPEEVERARMYLEIAARFTGMVQGPQNAQIVRRRAAAA